MTDTPPPDAPDQPTDPDSSPLAPEALPVSPEVPAAPETPPTRKNPLLSGVRFVALLAFFLAISWWAYKSDFLIRYKGKPFADSRYTAGAQKVPGRVECAYYDLGGEGVAYHDLDAKNSGSGGLNPADGTYLNEFRKNEAVDISYTKFHDEIDNSPYNLVTPPPNQLYVGWTEPGEWFNITVQNGRSAEYTADLLYTSNRGGSISIDVNGKPATGALTIPTTYNAADPLAWRQWHHWNLARDLVRLKLGPGRSVLTVHIVSGGNMNLAYFDFKKAQ